MNRISSAELSRLRRIVNTAAASGRIEKIKDMLPQIIEYPVISTSALYTAIKNKQDAVVRTLVDAGLDTWLLESALKTAAQFPHPAAVKMLLPHIERQFAFSDALNNAAITARASVVEMLLSHDRLSKNLSASDLSVLLGNAITATDFASTDRSTLSAVLSYSEKQMEIKELFKFEHPLAAAASRDASELMRSWLPISPSGAIEAALQSCAARAPLRALKIIAEATHPTDMTAAAQAAAVQNDLDRIRLLLETGHNLKDAEVMRSAAFAGNTEIMAFAWARMSDKKVRARAFSLSLRSAVDADRLQAVDWLMALGPTPPGSVESALLAAIASHAHQDLALRLLPHSKPGKQLLLRAAQSARPGLQVFARVLSLTKPEFITKHRDEMITAAKLKRKDDVAIAAAIDHAILSAAQNSTLDASGCHPQSSPRARL